MIFNYNGLPVYKQGALHVTTPVFGSPAELSNRQGESSQRIETKEGNLSLGIVVPGGDKVDGVQEVTPMVLSGVEPLDPDEFPHQPYRRGGQLPSTIQNLGHLLKGYNITVAYDVIKKKLSLRIPGFSGSKDNTENASLAHVISLATLNRINTANVPMFIEALANTNLENPVLTWVKSKDWDGVDRIQSLCETLVVAEGYPPELRDKLVRKWFRSTVAALYIDGFRSRGVLTLQGGQGLGKTTWFLNLIPPGALRDAVILLDHHLDPSNKDSILSAVTHWLVEIGELDSSFRKDVARLKGFLTRNSDKVRRPYAKGESDYARRTVFAATVNDTNFLVDPTGNTRFWVVPITSINYNHGIDMQQVFAQMLEEVQQGESWYLTKEEEQMLEKLNETHQSISVIEEKIYSKYVKPDDRQDQPKYTTASYILNMLGYEKPTNAQCKEATRALTNLYGSPRRVKGYSQWRAYERPGDGPYELRLGKYDDEDEEY
jgi:hypothetical protein